MIRLGELIAGSKEAFGECPFINFGYCAAVSPLMLDFDSTETMMYFAENGITAYGTIAPMGALSGADFIVMGGLQDALMSFDFGQLMIDNEIAGMVKRVRSGFGFSREAVSLQEIKDTGPAGMFADNPVTLERMRAATFMPELADRNLREKWEQEGSSTIHQRALNKVLEILSTPNSVAFDKDIDTRIRAQFEGLVAGDSRPQEGCPLGALIVLDVSRNG